MKNRSFQFSSWQYLKLIGGQSKGLRIIKETGSTKEFLSIRNHVLWNTQFLTQVEIFILCSMFFLLCGALN